MYRTSSGIDIKRDSFPPFFGFNGVDVKCLQDFRMDTASTLSSPSISPTCTSVSSEDVSYTSSPTFHALTPSSHQQQCFGNLATSNLDGANQITLLTQSTTSQSPFVLKNNEILQQNGQYCLQNHYHQQHQQQLNAALIARQQKNEISKSLKTFAMLTSYKCESDPNNLYTAAPVEAIMQEFARNGYSADDLNCYYQQQLYDSSNMHITNSNVMNKSNSSNSSSNNMDLNLTNCDNSNSNGKSISSGLNFNGINPYHYNANNHDVRKHLWMLQLSQQYLPATSPSTQQQHQTATVASVAAAAAATAAAAANIDYNSQNIQNTNKRPQKRYTAKSDKFTAVKHCVFCENNNEPAAVVKSHAVRDALGRVLCPKLRTYICPICKASGDMAHTVKYCPQKPIITMEDAIKADSIRQFKTSMYKYGMKV